MCVPAVALIFGGGMACTAQIVIDVGSHTLQPNVAGQVIEFSASNTSLTTDFSFQGFEFNLQVGDGGAAAGGVSNGPRFTAVDLVTGTPFEGNSVGTYDASGSLQSLHPLLAFYGTLTLTGDAVLRAGETRLIARVTFDTTGLNAGSWSLAASNTVNGPTKFVNVDVPGDDGNGNLFPYVYEGTVTLQGVPVPEPCIGVAVGTFLVGFVGWRRWGCAEGSGGTAD